MPAGPVGGGGSRAGAVSATGVARTITYPQGKYPPTTAHDLPHGIARVAPVRSGRPQLGAAGFTNPTNVGYSAAMLARQRQFPGGPPRQYGRKGPFIYQPLVVTAFSIR